MTTARRKRTPRTDARVLISDILPFEVPPAFSNRGFYEFVNEAGLSISDERAVWRRGDPARDALVKIILGHKPTETSVPLPGNLQGVKVDEGEYSIPYKFKIGRRDGRSRMLSVVHPKNQLSVVSFYSRHAQSMLSHTRGSSITLRAPEKIATYSIAKDELHRQLRQTWEPGVEVKSSEPDTLRSYFAYREFGNIYRFYESKDYQSLEKRYRRLLRLDVSQCFASIYTHSVAWAVFGKTTVKTYLRPGHMKRQDRRPSFPEQFDTLMQRLNYNETNGIVVGPEFSRIFAEVILQRVDQEVLRSLASSNLGVGTQFEIRRYVDDYFIFHNDEESGEKVKAALEAQLAEYNLHLNPIKQVGTLNPDVTPITVAKLRARRLLKRRIAFDRLDENASQSQRERSTQTLITDYKAIVKETGVEGADILNYVLTITERRLVKLLRDYNGSTSKSPDALCSAIRTILEFVFFVYGNAALPNPTVKTLRIVDHALQFLERHEFAPEMRAMITDCVYAEILEHLDKSVPNENIRVENLYLVSALLRLGPRYLLSQQQLAALFSVTIDEKRGAEIGTDLDYFAITTLLQYMRRRHRYASLRDAVVSHAFQRVDDLAENSSERIHLLLDILSCPFVDKKLKMDFLGTHGIVLNKLRESVISHRRYWFTKWSRFDLSQALELKRHQEVY